MLKLLMANRFERPLAYEETPFDALVRQAGNDVATFVEWRHQVLEVDAPPHLGLILVDPDKIRDSIAHLLLNAIKFTRDGGTIRLAGRRLANDLAEIQVSDNGVGIDQASLARLFEPFFTRFDVSRHSSGVFEFDRRGLGLGLSLVKAFVEMHGGRVKASSVPGKGSTFTITIPTRPPTSSRADLPSEGEL
jgi:signal transduction histidine kinase